MKKGFLFFSILVCLITLAFGQVERQNQLDANGKLTGQIMIYLDNKWNVIKDSANAVYCRYTWYEHGANIDYKMGSFNRLELELDSNSFQKDKPRLLDGEYKWLDKKRKVKSIVFFKQGNLISYKEFFPSGKLHENIDYTRKWLNQPHTYCQLVYDKKGNSKCFYMRSGPYGWLGYGWAGGDSVKVDTLKVSGDSRFLVLKIYNRDGEIINQRDEIWVQKSDGRTETICHGHTISWYSNGQKLEEGNYYFGRKNGQWKLWDKNGVLKKNEQFKN